MECRQRRCGLGIKALGTKHNGSAWNFGGVSGCVTSVAGVMDKLGMGDQGGASGFVMPAAAMINVLIVGNCGRAQRE